MIPRYSRQQMVDIWSPETKFRIWFEIEAHACDAQAKLGVIPETAAKASMAESVSDKHLYAGAHRPHRCH